MNIFPEYNRFYEKFTEDSDFCHKRFLKSS